MSRRAMRAGPRKAAGAAVLLLALAGCTRHGKDQGSVLHRRLDGEPKTLNALLITSDPDQQVLSMISRNLLDYDTRLELIPGLAESVEADESHLVYTVKLRKEARWEDGSPVTSDDLAVTLETLMDPGTPALSRRGFFEGFERVEKVDARTARVVFKEAYAGRREAFNISLIPAAQYRGGNLLTSPHNRKPLANGPYRLARWDAGRSLELVRNTQYWGEKAPAESVVFHLVTDSQAAFQGLLTGQLDECRLSFELKKKLDEAARQPGARVRPLVWEELSYNYLGWNNRLPLFSDRRVRRALTMLLDREGLVKSSLYGGLARVSNGPVPPGLWSHDAGIQPWPYDPAAAEALLDEAGFRKGPDGVRARGGDRFAFDLLVGAGSDLQRQVAEFAQQSYRKAGIEMTIRPMEWAAFSSKVDEGDYQACLLAWALDPNADLAPNWHSSQVPPSGLNSAFYRNERADALMDQLKTTFDREKARPLYQELQRLIHEDEPVTFLITPTVKWGVSTALEGVSPSPIGLFLTWPGGAGWSRPRVKKAE